MNDVFAKIDAAQKVVNELCDGTRTWTLSIPARVDHDPDLVISAALEAARAELAALTPKPVERPVVEGWYWCRWRDEWGASGESFCVRVVGGTAFMGYGNSNGISIGYLTDFHGPLQPPVMP